jgi:hypothetical protein
MPSGFTPVNSGGFTSVNSQTPQATPAQPSAPGSFSTLNTPNGFHREHVDSRTATPLRNGGSPMLSAHNTPDLRPAALGLTPLSNGQAFNQLKRTLSQDAEDSSNGDADENGRRSKRLKKGKQNCAAVSLHLPSEQGCRVIASVLIQARVRRALHLPLVDLLANATTCRCGAHRCGLAHDPATPIDARLDILSPGTCHG